MEEPDSPKCGDAARGHVWKNPTRGRVREDVTYGSTWGSRRTEMRRKSDAQTCARECYVRTREGRIRLTDVREGMRRMDACGEVRHADVRQRIWRTEVRRSPPYGNAQIIRHMKARKDAMCGSARGDATQQQESRRNHLRCGSARGDATHGSTRRSNTLKNETLCKNLHIFLAINMHRVLGLAPTRPAPLQT